MTPREIIVDCLAKSYGTPSGANPTYKRIERALADAGYVIVPKIANDKMICAALDAADRGEVSYSDAYSAMIYAA